MAGAFAPAAAFQSVESSGVNAPLAAHLVHAAEFDVQPSIMAGTGLQGLAREHGVVADFLQRHPGEWQVTWDRRNDRPNMISGSGIALVPGRGNRLRAADIGLRAGETADFAVVTALLEDFIAENAALLGAEGLNFAVDTRTTDAFGPQGSHWLIDFHQVQGGVPVHDAQLFFRIAAGNIVQFGNERVAPIVTDTRPSLDAAAAFTPAFKAMDFPVGTEVTDWAERGALELRPYMPDGAAMLGEPFAGTPGSGYAHKLVWRYVFRVAGDRATYRVLVDAHSGELLDARDINQYATAQVSGGVYPAGARNIPGTEQIVPFPYVAVSNGGSKVTDANGEYNYSGGTASTTLNGKYIRVSDNCGNPSLSNSSTGDLALGTSGGTDCTKPANGSSTHAARNAFFYLTEVNRQAASYYPSSSWLNGTVTANVNSNQTCNAYWDGSSLTFFKSGGGCANTGELSGVFMHEFGHGIQQNIGGSPSEQGTGEATGDTFAFLQTRDGCIGDGFLLNSSAACTGVRDVSEYAVHGGNGFVLEPSNIGSSAGPNCAQYGCPYYANGFQPYMGPMGYEGHCESLIAGSANWDLAQELVGALGVEPGWQHMTDLWYAILPDNRSAYRVESGGQCNTDAVVNGCGSNNWYNLYLAADDDDGNLANGTPNACRIWDAFNAHGIACGTRPTCSTSAPGMALELTPPSAGVCRPGSATYTVGTMALGNPPLTSPISFTASGLPSGVSASFSPNPVTPGASSTLTLSAGGSAAAGSVNFTVTGSASGASSESTSGSLLISAGVPSAPALATPADGATSVATPVAFSWGAVSGVDSYTLEVATDAAFGNIVNTQNVGGTSATAALTAATSYHWRVTATNGCGMGAASVVRSFTTAAAPFPAPYCNVSFPNAVEPITRVTVGGIDNSSSATINGSPALEDFTHITGHVERGDSLPIAVRGNTAGNYTTAIRVYVDWNQDGDFDDTGESHALSSLSNSTGSDGKEATGTLTVPSGALLGPTRMRVVKKYGSSAPACGTDGWGQAEDYTLQVGTPGPVLDPLATVTPAALSVTVAANQTASATLNIANAAGRDPLTWSIASHQALLAPVTGAPAQLRRATQPRVELQARGNGGDSVQALRAPVQPHANYSFQRDDGSYENSVGLGSNGPPATESAAIWINRFAVPEAVTVDSISILWPTNTGATLVGLQANLVVYHDADADGDPGNAVRIGSDEMVTIGGLDAFETYTTNFEVPGAGDVYIGFVDQWALAGGYEPRLFPAALDQDSPQGMSWVSGASTPPADLDHLGNNDMTGTIGALGGASLDGNWLIRATATTASSACSGAVIGWVTPSPASGTVAGGASTNVAVTVDPAAGSLATGSHAAELCITTNDPTQPLIAVPVAVTVTPATGPVTHVVTPSVGSPSGSISPSTPQTVNDGSNFSFTLTPDTGYEIDNVGGSCGGSLAGNTFTTAAVTADCSVVANFKPTGGSNLVCGTLNASLVQSLDGTTFDFVTGQVGTYDGGRVDDINLYDYGAGMYAYWYGDMSSFAVGGLVDGSGEFAVLQGGDTVGAGATFSGSSVAMTNWVGGVSGYLGIAFENEGTGQLNYGWIQMTTSGPDGYPATWGDYCYDASGADVVIPTDSTPDHTVTASAPGGNGTITPPSQTVNDGGTASFTVTPDTGYHVDSVTGDTCTVTGSGTNWSAASIQADCEVTASFAIDEYTVAAASAGNGTITPPSQTVSHGGMATFTVAPDAGYHVAGVTGDTCTVTGSGTSWSAANIQADCTVTASFTIDEYTVTAAAPGGNGAIQPPSQTVSHGGMATFTVAPDAGYHVAGVTGDTCTVTGSGTSWSAANIQADCTVTASFTIDEYTVTAAAPGGNGAIQPPSQTVSHGGTASFTVAPDAGYHVASVTGDTCAVTGSGTSWSAASIQADCTVTASFAADILVFSVQPGNLLQGEMLGQVEVSLQDGSGHVQPGSGPVDFTFAACGDTLHLGTATMVNGVATLDSGQRFYTLASGLHLEASHAAGSVTSAGFTVTVNADLVLADGFDLCRP